MSASLHDLAALNTRITRARHRARRVLVVERAWPGLRISVALLGLYVLAGLLRWPQRMPDVVHAIVLGIMLTAIFVLALRGIRRITSPTRTELDGRIERASRLPFQPLLTLRDRPANIASEQLWHAHIARISQGLGKLRVGWPRPAFDARERFCAGLLAAALLVAGLCAGSSAPSRIVAAFVPGVDDADVPLPEIQAWIDLPSYAPGAPIFLSKDSTGIDVPEGARLTANVIGTISAPYLTGALTTAQDDKRLDPRSWIFHATLNGSGRLLLRARGRTLAQWNVHVQPDVAPEVSWDGTPGAEPNGWRTRLPWKVSQAHGVQSLQVDMRLKHHDNPRVLTVPITLAGSPKSAKNVTETDLSADPWAGEEVEATLLATSTSGLQSRSKPLTFRLPARLFHDPIAKSLIALRRRLALGEENRVAAADDLRALVQVMPSAETGAILALDLAASGLENPDVEDGKEQAIGLSWSVARYLEDLRETDRETAMANLDIRAAQAAVQAQLDHMHKLGQAGQAMPQQEELAQRMKTLRQAIDRRMQALMRQAMQNGSMLPETSQDQGDADDAFSRLMRRLQSDATNGHGDDAMRRLQELESMTERMRDATPEDLANMARQMRAQAEAQTQRRALRDLVKHEAGLLDHTQSRLGAQHRAISADEDDPGQNNGDQQDLATMSTSELLRRLGLQVAPNAVNSSMPSSINTQPGTSSTVGMSVLDPAVQIKQNEERRGDHAIQRSLRRVDGLLNDDVKGLTGKPLDGLKKAEVDMLKARKALAGANDDEAQTAEQQAIKDLAEAGKQMSEAQKGQSKGGGPIALLPGFGQSGHQSGGAKSGSGHGDEDSDGASADHQSNRDPLGRKLGEGNQDMDTDSHIPDANQRDRAREIERELRRRDADRTRPQAELDYLDRLLKAY